MGISIEQTAKQNKTRNWRWSIWLEGSEGELDKLQSVTYQLHPTFTNPIRTITNRKSGFRLKSSGWGQFMIYMTLQYHDGTEEKRQHWLKFDSKAKTKALTKTPESISKNELTERSPTAFLSFSVADTVAAMAVRRGLEEKGVSVLDASKINAGENLSDGIEKMINQSDFGVSVISDISSNWLKMETSQMQSRDLPIFDVYASQEFGSMHVDLKVEPQGDSGTTEFAELVDASVSQNSIDN